MSSIRLQGVSFAWPSGVSVLRDVDLHFPLGFTAITGPNGVGKSTLLRLITGDLFPDTGRILTDPPGMRIGWLRQTDEGTGSPGELRRSRLGEILRERPDLLILDEPSNHLDASSRRWLVGALQRFAGIGLLVSHDRELMEAVAPRTVRIEGGSASLWALSYGAAREAWSHQHREQWKTLEQAQQRVRAAASTLGDSRRERDAADRNRSSQVRMKSPKDNDARGSLAKGKARIGEMAAGRQVGLARRALQRASEALAGIEVPKDRGRPIALGYTPSERPWIANFQGELFGQRLDLRIERETRLWLQGPNGCGKSTLLRALLGPKGILYLPQVLDAEAARNDLAQLLAFSADLRGRVLAHVAALGVDPARLLASPEPSPGEARKLRLALGLGGSYSALFLDEPTNDLDLPAIERLEEALSGWPGALVLITHDVRLGQRVTLVQHHCTRCSPSKGSFAR